MNRQKLISAFIIDDNREAITLLQQMLESRYSVDVVGTATDAETALKAVPEAEPDLIFLDVELPTMSGLDFLTLVRPLVKQEMKVVFYTGYDKYMLEAIRRQAFDYLLKPATEQELSQIMTRYYENKLAAISQPTLRPNEQLPIILVVNAMNEFSTLRANDCAFFRYNTDRKLWEVQCIDGRSYTLRHRTTADVILSYTADFIQTHKRYIVNINHITMILDTTCHVVSVPQEQNEPKISKNFRRQLMEKFYNL
ncbi:MAG: response regulator transcription factor [Prevotella sp.]|nr:response regulator transcription factor [Prevotella sp.]